jgi:hypothetical protein
LETGISFIAIGGFEIDCCKMEGLEKVGLLGSDKRNKTIPRTSSTIAHQLSYGCL